MDETADLARWLATESAPAESFQYMALDPELFSGYREFRDRLFEGVSVSRKTKMLMALAVLTSHGATDGMKFYASSAIRDGATIEELKESVRVGILFSGGVGITAALHLVDTFATITSGDDQ